MRQSLVWVLALAGCGGAASGGDACYVDGECPVHQLCESGVCSTGCIGDGDCAAGQQCSAHGRCAAEFDATASIVDFAVAADFAVPDDLSDAAASFDLARWCGDGHVDPGEACDDGGGNSDDPAVQASCTSHCRKRAGCGVLTGSSGAHIDPDSGHCYVAWPGPANWAAAQQKCQAPGGALVMAESAAEEALVKTLASGVVSWIGLRASNSDGDCSWVEGGSFKDAPCGWPATGLLPASPASTAGWVCESGCGNGVVESGEECDSAPGCTATCRTIRSCAEGMTSTVSGHCYFVAGPASDYSGALTACPAGTHLATLETPDETELGRKLITTDTWIGLRSPTTVGVFAWDHAGDQFVPARYHGFIDGEPNHNASPTCVRLISTGWRDQICTSSYVHLCERE